MIPELRDHRGHRLEDTKPNVHPVALAPAFDDEPTERELRIEQEARHVAGGPDE